MSGFSTDSVHLANQLRHPPNHGLNVSPTIIPSSSPPPIITSKPPSGDLEHKQKVSIPLSKLKEIPAPIHQELAQSNKTRNRVLEKNSQGEIETFNQEIPEARPVIKRVDLSDTTMRSSPISSRHQLFVMPIRNVSHDYRDGSESHEDSLITSSENLLSFSALPKTELKQEVIPSRNKSNGREDDVGLVETPSINCDETLKLDKVVSEGYRVLKEVKRHKNKAEMEWDLARLEESRLPQLLLQKIPQQESRKHASKQNRREKPQSAENNQSSFDPPCFSHSTGLPEMQQLYQCIATKQLPFAHVSYQPHPPVFPWQPATIVPPDSVIHSKDVGVEIEKEKEVKKANELVLEVLPSVNILECEQQVEEPSQDNSTVATPNDLSLPSNDFTIRSNEPSPVMTPELSPQSSPNMPHPSLVVPHCDCSCTHHKPCEEEQLLPSSDIVNQRMQSHITTQAKEWAQREIMANVLSRVTTDTLQDGMGGDSIADSEVVDIVRKELFEQMLLLLKETPCKEDTVSSDQTHYEESLKDTEYSLSFETETSESHAHPQMIPTPQITPPPSPPLSPQFDMIPTPEPSPLVSRQEHVIDSLSNNVSTPDVTTEISVHSEKTNSLTTPSLTTPSIYPKSEGTIITKPSVPANISLSLSETTPTSSTPPSTNIRLSTTFTSTDHDISYGEQLVSHPNISGRGSEGEVILSPGDARWKTQVPLRLKEVITSRKKKGLCTTISDGGSSRTSESQVTTTSIGEIKSGKTRRGNNPFDRYLHTKLSTSTPDGSDTSHNDTMSSKKEEERVSDEDTLANVPSLSEGLSLLKLDPGNGNNRLNIRKATENEKGTDEACLSPGEIQHAFHNKASRTVDTTQSISVGEAVDLGHPLLQDVNSISSTSLTSSITNRLRDGIDVIDVSSNNTITTEKGTVHNGTMHNRITISSIAPADTPQRCGIADTLGMTGPVILMGSSDKDDLATDDCSFTFSTSSIPLPN